MPTGRPLLKAPPPWKPANPFTNRVDSDEALPLLRQAVRDEGRSAPARYWLGMAWLALGNEDEALKAFRRTTQLDKHWAPGHVGMAMVYMRSPNRRLDARKALRKAIEADPDDADIHYYLGMTYMDQVRTGRLIGSEKDGRRNFQKTVELNPSASGRLLSTRPLLRQST